MHWRWHITQVRQSLNGVDNAGDFTLSKDHWSAINCIESGRNTQVWTFHQKRRTDVRSVSLREVAELSGSVRWTLSADSIHLRHKNHLNCKTLKERRPKSWTKQGPYLISDARNLPPFYFVHKPGNKSQERKCLTIIVAPTDGKK